MRIYIPTLGRPNEQHAYTQLRTAGLDPTLVIDESDESDYDDYQFVRVGVKGIAAKRQACLHMARGRKFAMIDDDITFNRADMVEGKLVTGVPTPRRLALEFKNIDKLLNTFAHVGIYPTRQFINYAKQPYTTNNGYIRGGACFFNPALMPVVPRFEGHSAEDVRFMIALLEQGLDYAIVTSLYVNEIKSKTLPSHWNQEQKNKDMHQLASEHPRFARPLKDGRVTLTYAGILKAAKRRIADES